MKKRFLRLAAGLLLGSAVLISGVWVLSKELAMREMYYHGKPREYWMAQVDATDAAASNEANAILNAEIIPHLTGVMFHDTNDSALRVALVDGLNNLPCVDIPFMPAYDRRKSAAHELGTYGPAARAAVPALVQALNSDDDAVRETAAISLGNIHAAPDTVIPALTQCLGDYGVNAKAVSALGQFGAAAKAAVPQIIILMQANDPETKWAAGEALRKIDPEAFAQMRNAANNAKTNKAGAEGMPAAK